MSDNSTQAGAVFRETFGPVPKVVAAMTAPTVRAAKRAFADVAYCSTPGCRNHEISWCHVIPRAAQLDEIAEDGKVSWVPMKQGDRWTYNSYWKADPVSKVLTFRGFCNECDSSIFAAIDKPLGTIDADTALRLAYRAAAFEEWRHWVDMRQVQFMGEEMRAAHDRGELPAALNDGFDKYIADQVDGLEERHKLVSESFASLGKAVEAGDTGYVESAVFDLGRSLPFRYSVATTFALSLRLFSVKISQGECPRHPALFIHVLNAGGTSKIVVSWPRYVPRRFVDGWVQDLRSYSERGILADVLTRYMIVGNHGLAMSPSWPAGWSIEQNSWLSAPIAGNFYFGHKVEVTRLSDPPYFTGIKIKS